jgi:hypothetical protein
MQANHQRFRVAASSLPRECPSVPRAAAGALEIVRMIVSINQPDARDRAGIQHDRVVAALAEHLNWCCRPSPGRRRRIRRA